VALVVAPIVAGTTMDPASSRWLRELVGLHRERKGHLGRLTG
jgi:hypothetical protein